MKMDLLVGQVTHYYDKIGVAIIAILNQPLRVGDTVKFSGHDQEFTQKIDSMQIEHQQIPEAKPGTTIGLKTEKAVKEKDQVYLVS